MSQGEFLLAFSDLLHDWHGFRISTASLELVLAELGLELAPKKEIGWLGVASVDLTRDPAEALQ